LNQMHVYLSNVLKLNIIAHNFGWLCFSVTTLAYHTDFFN
jgi:hypothetical protein